MVKFIGATTIDWNTFIATCSGVLSQSPTREIDAKGLKVGGLNTYSMALENLNNNPDAIGNLLLAHRSLSFIHLTFIIVSNDSEAFLSFQQINESKTISIDRGTKTVCVLCASLAELVILVKKGCTEKVQENIRKICNDIYVILDHLGFKALFGSKRELLDKTFVLTP